MGRKKGFERDDVLTAVMHLFREQGFEGTSLKDLEKATRLNPSSLYNSFGSKHDLFIEALQFYNQQIVAQRIEVYLPKGCGLEGIIGLFQSVLELPKNQVKGCLLTNSAIEFAGQGQDISVVIAAGFDLLKAAFIKVLQDEGGVGVDAHYIERQAMQVLGFYQGVLVMARFNPADPHLPIMIDDFFSQFQH